MCFKSTHSAVDQKRLGHVTAKMSHWGSSTDGCSPSSSKGKGGRGGKGGGKGDRVHGRGGRGADGRVDAPLLNSWLSKATSTDALLLIFTEHGQGMDAMHMGNLWNKLSKHLKVLPSRTAWVQSHTEVLEKLVADTVTRSDACGAQQLANIAQAAAHVGLAHAAANDLFGALAARSRTFHVPRSTQLHQPSITSL